MSITKNEPVSQAQLQEIAQEACETALSSAKNYEHSQTEQWNSTIINHMLSSLIPSTQPDDSSTQPQYKYAVNSTIIQHLVDLSPASASTHTQTDDASGPSPDTYAAGGQAADKGRRGMHSATGAYWNNETDGMWSWKYEGGERKGMDVVINVLWISMI